jgi:hypothetical protein
VNPRSSVDRDVIVSWISFKSAMVTDDHYHKPIFASPMVA